MEKGGEDSVHEGGEEDKVGEDVVYYGVCIPENLLEDVQDPVQTVFTDKLQALKALKEYKGSRFKSFSSEVEAVEFSTSRQPVQETQVSTPVPGESSAFSSLKPQQLVKFRKAIEAANTQFVQECIRENPRYLMTPSDTPAVLQEGSRYNALHIAAKAGKHDIMNIILNVIKDSVTQTMYPEADPEQNEVRQQRLLDLYLNMPDKGGGDTPLHLASKFGHLGVVQLLTSESSLVTTTLNKFGESPLDVVCTRAKVKCKETEDKIRETIQGLCYIPVYRELDGPPVLGEPIPVAQAQCIRSAGASLDDTDSRLTPSRPGSASNRQSSFSIASPSPRLGTLNRTFTLSGSSPGSPFSILSQGNGNCVTSPGYLQSPSQVARSPVLISALIGPMSEKKAKSAYKELRSTNSRERLQNPAKGLERQCDGLAKRIQAEFVEYWEFLGDFLDLTSQEGLTRLETHLGNIQLEYTRQLQADRCRELEDSDPADTSVFLGEMEFAAGSSQNNNQYDVLGEMELSAGNSKSGSSLTKLETNSINDTKNSQDTPLSPISMLSTAMDGLDFGTTRLSSSLIINGMTTEETSSRGQRSSASSDGKTGEDTVRSRKPSVEAKEMVEQFAFMFSQALTENLPTTDSDTNIQDWGLSLVNHWDVLRRQVNMMRSDPQARWDRIDFSALACRVVEFVHRELEDSVLIAEFARVQAFLDRIASFKLNSVSEERREPENISEFRIQRQNSTRDVNRLREIQPFARILVFFMENRKFPERENLEAIWDIASSVNISTHRVNKARRFLHSKVFSDSESASSAGSSICQIDDDFSWINQSISKQSADPDTSDSPQHDTVDISSFRVHRQRANSVSSQSSQASSQYETPPSSPALSQASSMMTADEGVVVWMEGTSPTQTDRQVWTALQTVPHETLQKYPNLSTYLIIAGNYTMSEMRRWPARLKPVKTGRQDMEPRKLDLDFSSMQL